MFRRSFGALLFLALFGAPLLPAAQVIGIGTQAPDFALPAFSGGNVRLSEFRGQVVALTFWSSRCATCATQLRSLTEMQTTYGPAGLVTLAVSVDDDLERAREFAGRQAAGVPLLLDAQRAVGRMYAIDRLPTIVLIDRAGKVRQLYRDFRRTDNPYISQVRALLDDAPMADRSKFEVGRNP